MKKYIFTIFAVIILSLSTLTVCASEEAISPATLSEEGVSPMSEETMWYTRIYNGMLQKRLWSITYGKWLTDWIDVEPVE